MSPILDSIRRFLSPIEQIPAGMYHYQSPPSDPRNYRLHLRLEVDGSGILIINAATILHLNRTAAEYAYYLVQNIPVEAASQKMSKRYNVSQEQARQDYEELIKRIQTLIEMPDLDPVTFLDFDRQKPFSGSISAPYRLDIALTYHLAYGSDAAAAPIERVKEELTTTQWQKVLDKAWQAGIPHVVFTGGEPTLRPDLPELLAYAEERGLVSGLISDGLRLADQTYLDSLLQTGLDHLMLIIQPENETSWVALQNALAADLFVAVHVTVSAHNQAEIPALLEKLAGLGVEAVSLSASEPGLVDALQAARDKIAALHLELVWNLPVPYSNLHPVALELTEAEKPDGAGVAWMYVEPDGDVLPAQGINEPQGNLLSEPWEAIWKR